MLITDLTLTQRRTLAREIRLMIEPNNQVKSKAILKEIAVRKFLSDKGYSISGISDVAEILKSNYSESTVSRLIAKIQKSIVLDTCVCRLETSVLEQILTSPNNFIITSDVYSELVKLACSDSANKDGVENAKRLIYDIVSDTDSQNCTVVDVPMNNSTYVDDQILLYCQKNNYELYTHDYVCALRAKIRRIDVTVFSSFDFKNVETYTQNPSGKNIILNVDLLSNVSAAEIIKNALAIAANKFIITKSFIENLENKDVKWNSNDIIRFLVANISNDFIYYVPEEEDNNDIKHLAEKYNAVVFTSNIKTCLEYKANFVPYKLVGFSSSREKFLARARVLYNYPDTAGSNVSKSRTSMLSNKSDVKSFFCARKHTEKGVTTFEENKKINDYNCSGKIEDVKEPSNPALASLYNDIHIEVRANFTTKLDKQTAISSNSNCNIVKSTTSFVPSSSSIAEQLKALQPKKELTKLCSNSFSQFELYQSPPEDATSLVVPYYKPKSKTIPLTSLPPNESIYVLDTLGKQVNPNYKKVYSVLPGYTIIYVVNTLSGKEKPLKMTIYKILNDQTRNYGTKLHSFKFAKDDYTGIPLEYKSYALKCAILL